MNFYTGKFSKFQPDGSIKSFDPYDPRQPIEESYERPLHCVGKIQVQGQALNALFGPPTWTHKPGESISYEWYFELPNGSQGVVYDFRSPDKNLRDINLWMVGGETVSALYCLEMVLEQNNIPFLRVFLASEDDDD